MKKKIAMLFAFCMLVSATGCGTSESSSSKAETINEVSESAKSVADSTEDTDSTADAETIPDGDFAVSGDGTIYISTPGGTSEDGNTPVIYVSGDTSMEQIGLNSREYDGSMLCYIYIDGTLVDKHQMADTQASITLQGDCIDVGVHDVEVVQYTDDTPSADTVASYQKMAYEIKSE